MKKNIGIAAVCIAVSCLVGFLAGTEYQKKQSLRVAKDEIPFLLIDKPIYEMAVSSETAKASPDVLVLCHLQSQLNIIECRIATARAGNDIAKNVTH